MPSRFFTVVDLCVPPWIRLSRPSLTHDQTMLKQTRSLHSQVSGWAGFRFWKVQGASGEPINSGVLEQMPVKLHIAAVDRTLGPQANFIKSVPEIWADTLTLMIRWRSFYMAQARLSVQPFTKELVLVLNRWVNFHWLAVPWICSVQYGWVSPGSR